MVQPTASTTRKYVWNETRNVAHIDKVSPGVFAEEVEAVRRDRGDIVEARDIVDRARPPESRIHPLFDWNNAQAAERWRQHQARNALNALRVVVRESEGMGKPQTQIVHIHVKATDGRRGYTTLESASLRPEYREQIMEDAWRFLDAFERRFRNLYDEL